MDIDQKLPGRHKRKVSGRGIVVAVVVGALLFAVPGGHSLLHPSDTLDVGDYADTNTNPANWVWRGYSFTVSQPICVTALYGGFSGTAVFHVALYEAPELEMVGQTATTLLGAANPDNERFARAEIDAVLLLPGQPYVLAQGRESGSGSHYWVANLDPAALVLGESQIADWAPGSGDIFFWSGAQTPDDLLSTPTTGTHPSSPPHVGFDWESALPVLGCLPL